MAATHCCNPKADRSGLGGRRGTNLNVLCDSFLLMPLLLLPWACQVTTENSPHRVLNYSTFAMHAGPFPVELSVSCSNVFSSDDRSPILSTTQVMNDPSRSHIFLSAAAKAAGVIGVILPGCKPIGTSTIALP